MDNLKAEDRPFSVTEVSQINNLDTARMALRWALERLALIEKKATDFETQLAEADKKRQEAEDAAEAARLALTEREAYMQRVEDIALLKPEVRDSVEALAKREAESQRGHESIVAGLKRRLTLAEEAARRSQAMTESREALLTEREKVWLKEKEDILGRQEAAARLSEHSWSRQKAKLIEELEIARRKLQDQGEAVLEMESQAEDVGRVREEADPWRRKYQENLNRFLEVEKRSVESEERARRAEAHVKARESAAGEAETVWLREKARLLGELDSHRLRGHDLLSQVAALEDRIASLESEARPSGGSTDAELLERELRLDKKARELTALAETLESRFQPEGQAAVSESRHHGH